MRVWTIVLAVALLAGCSAGQQPSPRPSPAEIAFERGGSGVEATLAHGERMTWVLGCRGCHGKDLRGQIWDDNPKVWGVTWSPNLTRSADAMSAEQLEAVIARGVHPRRPQLWSMPSELFQHLAPGDLAAVIAYLRSLPPAGEASPDPQLGPRARSEIATGAYKPAATLVRELRDVLPVQAGGRHALGRYIASVTCAECHGPRLEGDERGEEKTPDLIVAAAYSRAEFEKLTTLGEAKDGRKIASLMVSVGRGRFSHMTVAERDALYAYLVARAELPR